jgi:import inner membrane translocase subunit TIM44
MRSRPIHLLLLRHGLRYSQPSTRRTPSRLAAAGSAFRPVNAAASFHSSTTRLDDNRSSLPQSPWRVFVDTLTSELKKNRELAEDVKQLQGDVDKLADAAAIKKAKDLYLRTRVSHRDLAKEPCNT